MIRPVPHWADSPKVHAARERCRFKMYSFRELCRMSPAEWDEECRRNGVPITDDDEED
jgi:hypothetical protein